MRKSLFFAVLLFIGLLLTGCVLTNDIIPDADKIVVTKYGTDKDTIDQTITITDRDKVNYIINNINTLTLEKMDYIKPNEVKYTLVFYNSSSEVKEMDIKSDVYVSFKGDNNPYFIKKGQLDIEYIEKLFSPLSEEEIINQLIISAYKEKYDVKEEVLIDKIYTKFIKNDLLVIPYMIASFADEGLWNEKVEGISFYYRDSRRIEVYYNGNIYTLNEGVERGLLTQDDLIFIAKIQNENCKLGHSWDDGELNQVPGGGEDIIYTCLVCGERKTEKVNSKETYSLTVTGKVEYLKNDISGEYGPTSLITIVTDILIDASIEVYANGIKVPIVTKPTLGDGWYYQFGMPSEDVVVEIKVVTIEYASLNELKGYEWVNELEREDIIEVRYESSAIGISPGNLINIEYSNHSADIVNVYNAIVWGLFEETELEYVITEGGGYSKYTFITNENSYSINFQNRFISVYNSETDETKYYKFLQEDYQFLNPYLKCNSFLVYNNEYQVFIADGTNIGEYENLNEFEFIPYEGAIPEWLTPYYIETQFGRVYIHTEDIIYLKNENTFTYFKIVGDKNFSFLFY